MSKSIYSKGKIYYDVIDILFEHKSYPVVGEHNFTNGLDVTGRYELKTHCEVCGFNDRCAAHCQDNFCENVKQVATSTPSEESARERGKEMVEKFRENIHDGYMDEQYDSAKQCALICLSEIEKALTEYGRATDELQNMDRTFVYYESIKQQIINS